MEHNNQHPACSKCLFLFFDLIGVQQRHLCLGVVICCLSGGIIIAEFQQHSPFYSGYWMGSGDLFTALFIFVCAIKPMKATLAITAMLDAVATAITFAGSFQLITLKTEITYITAWIGLATLFFLAYHCISCVYDAGICRKWMNRNEADAAPSITENTNELQEEEAGGRENRGARRHRRRTQSPPIDFRLPDEIPTLPEYDELSKSEGLPPNYETLNIAPPEYTPPTTGVTINGGTYI